jgi:hypothetical protein
MRPLPAIAIGNLDPRGLATVTPNMSMDSAVEFGLLLIDAIDAWLDPAPTSADDAATPA